MYVFTCCDTDTFLYLTCHFTNFFYEDGRPNTEDLLWGVILQTQANNIPRKGQNQHLNPDRLPLVGSAWPPPVLLGAADPRPENPQRLLALHKWILIGFTDTESSTGGSFISPWLYNKNFQSWNNYPGTLTPKKGSDNTHIYFFSLICLPCPSYPPISTPGPPLICFLSL